MKLIINTSTDPHFCALFDAQGVLVKRLEWTVKKADGAKIFEFLKKHDVQNMELSLIGGVSGPGGFSSIRVTASILNSIGFAKKLPVHQVRADIWISEFLRVNNYPPESFLLNSFSDGVFYVDQTSPLNKGRHEHNETSNKEAAEIQRNIKDSRIGVSPTELTRISISKATEKFQDTPLFVGLLPDEKKEQIKNQIKLSLKDSEKILLKVLEGSPSQRLFVPDYEFPPVQSTSTPSTPV